MAPETTVQHNSEYLIQSIVKYTGLRPERTCLMDNGKKKERERNEKYPFTQICIPNPHSLL